MSLPANEQELAATAVDWLKTQGWEVYQEVETTSGVCDIVACRCGVVWCLEAKMNLSFHLLAQAERWLGEAHQVSIIVPLRRNGARHFGHRVCKRFGFGVLEVGRDHLGLLSKRKRSVHNYVKPVFDEMADPQRIEAVLHPLHKTFAAAGSPGGRRLTRFKITAFEIEEVVSKNPGITLKELVAAVDHHWPNERAAKQAIPRHVESGLIKCRAEKDRGRWRFYPVDQPGDMDQS